MQALRRATAAGVFLLLVPAQAAQSPGEGDWITYNGSLSGDRYSPLREITTANVGRLRPVCTFETNDTVSFQTGIVAVGGTLYVTAFNHTYAIDGATCRQLWKHTRQEPPNYLKVNRGVGYADGKLFRGTGDAHVVALDAKTGNELWVTRIGDATKGESTPMAPIAWNNLVFIGNAGGDNFGVVGRIYALDAGTGRQVWEFRVIPDSGPARATWPKASPENPPTGGATWTSYALDDRSGVLYVSTGNPAPDFVAALHPGDNLYSNSVLALDARSGRLLAYVQPVKDDFHDWDVSAGPALITTRDGTPFLLAAAKDGNVYGIDRSRLVNPQGMAAGVPGAADSTALPIRYRTAVTTRENVDAPLSPDRETRFCPGTQGGVEWNGPAYSREQGVLFVNAIDWCSSVRLAPMDSLKGQPGKPWTGSADPELAFGEFDPQESWKGWVTAVDAETGAIRWKYQSPTPMVAGITATAGGLVFTGDLNGDVLAFDAVSGKVLWKQPAGGAIGGGVMTYRAGGRQLVAAAVGLNSPIWPVKGGHARVAVFGLGN